MAFKGKDRRRHERVNRALALQFRIKKSKQKGINTDNWHLSLTIDMSASGVAFESPFALMIGDVLELHVVVSGVVEVVKAEGKVVRIEEVQPGKLYLVAVELKKHL